ncbi:putative ribonuclease III post-transcriptional gene silencing PAZ-Argonaute family [Rosa chinensis]|uniref:Putative ribonuclease III post-transcriptional gene silencing PAZ-Argonaute family n=1 Tax=Rosa chinensis TaxID=74649 RepID=A0A2P6Q1M0_ROSCH|nr:endoribonuclease Dicer homolog 3a isoform X1 [Rosa chinensis]PRQ28075.1 putative ribonuclease III post-transcriptional gene silencing PAZ-Argonaute family [Rosa chinensis]
MHLPEEEGQIPLKHSFTETTNDHGAAADQGVSKRLNPRRYQTQVYEVARKRNTIAVMETGTGKTMIAVMLIDEIGQAIKSSGDNKLIVFLAPTVHLVHQQFEVIKEHTTFKVEEYYGAKGVDAWDKEHWEKEFKTHDVLVMTPQILLDALRKAFLTIEAVCLMIMDECHRTTGNHPYKKIMKEFYHRSSIKPKVFGMTASPVIRKGVSSTMDCEDQISELESILDSQIYTIEDKTEMEVYAPTAKETRRFYNPTWFSSLDLKEKIKASWSKNDASFLKLQESIQSNFKDLDDKVKALRKRLSNDYEKILYCLDDLGLICAYEAVKVCLENAPTSEECEFYRESSLQCRYFLEEVFGIIKQSLSNGCENFLDVGFDYLKAVDLGYISPKLNELVQLFHSFGVSRELLCLIFVDRIVTAKVIERFMRKVTSLSHFKISYLTGSTTSVDALTPKVQKETLKLFSSGEVNLLFSTDVVEEGIHVPNCSCVIRFDLPKTVRSYVQSRGRSRQDNSQFIIMLERGNKQQRDQLYEIIKSEGLMTNTALNRDPEESVLKPCTLDQISEYVVNATGASVTADSSVRTIHKYCDTLPRDKYFVPRPAFQFSYLGDSYECKITLPPNAAFQTLVGPACKNSALSKQVVCLEACKKLHQLGALNDHLLPSTDKPLEKDINVESKGPASGAGTTKRKELHGTTGIRALSGTWAEKLDGAVFYAYKFDFSCDIVNELYSGFILLIESDLAKDVGNIELTLYLVSKKVKASVSSCGQVRLDGEQMAKAKLFQEFFFNGLFGKLFHRANPAEKQREFLLKKETRKLWRQSYMYLVLPLETLDDSNNESWTINWGGISSCVSVVEFLKQNALLGAQHCKGDARNSLQSRSDASGTGCNSSQIFHFADSSVNEKNLKDMVVVAIHTGKIYSVFEILSDTSAESPFDTSQYNTYAEYFHKKYGVLLMYPGQPLLRLKQNHNPHNLLVNFNGEGGSGKTSESGLVNGKERMYAHMPPELLVCTGLRRDVLKSFYLLPSLIHRLESLMLASQLREEIDSHCSLQISSSLILEALTSLRCSEDFSMERLELLGDSVLKYTVGCHLFLKYPEKHDGQLSSLRQSVICNANLHKLGIDRNLQGYIRDGAFDPRRWVGPGQVSIRPVPCECGVDTLEVPVDSKFQTRDREVVVGKCCDKGHRWMGSKTISDCVEALIGAYYVAGGLSAAVHFMKWLQIDVELEPSLVSEAITTASLHSCNPKVDEIGILEPKLRYVFSTKGLLQEAITHASEQESKLGYSYERLEFLGDCVLDLLITWYLYQNHKDIDPGELTDLRAASVNNENFAQAAVRHNLQQHLQHCSGLLQSQITEYVKLLSEHDSGDKLQGPKGPKALGDMVESIAGAILIDTELNLDEVWRVYKPLLSPIVTPDKLELPPLRELIELCGSLGYFYKEQTVKKGETVHAELSVQLKDVLLIGEGIDRSKKIAKGEAAHHLLKELEKRGITHSGSARKRKLGADQVDDSSPIKQKKTEMHLPMDATGLSLPATDRKISGSKNDIPVIKAINMKKGGPRVSLYELCKQLQWQMPTFKPTEKDSSFISTITLYIPNLGNIECTGDPRSDKKSSLDSAALLMLYDLERQGKIIIGGC